MLTWGKRVLKQTPLVGRVLGQLAYWQQFLWKRRSAEEVFTQIYRHNGWNGRESISGTGSDATQTSLLVAALPGLFAKHQIRSMLDIPCGDFHWMRDVDLRGVWYLGADIVRDLVERNQQYATNSITFRHLNLLEDELPRVDLIFCRDCLVHFSYDDIYRALRNVVASGSRFLLTTTFKDHARNRPIVTGKWQALNLERAPFQLPPPLTRIVENCTEDGGIHADKSLGLWRISDLEACLARRAA